MAPFRLVLTQATRHDLLRGSDLHPLVSFSFVASMENTNFYDTVDITDCHDEGQRAQEDEAAPQRKRGRPPHPVHKLFVPCPPPARASKTASTEWEACRACGVELKDEPKRLEEHLRHCPIIKRDPICPEKRSAVEAARKYLTDMRERSNIASIEDFLESPPPKFSRTEAESIISAAASMCFEDNRPFRLRETPAGRRFWSKAFRGSVPLPTSYVISEKELDRAYDEASEAMHGDLQNCEFVQLAADGWSDRARRGIFAMMAITPQAPHFYDSVDTTMEDCTADAVARHLLRCVESLKMEKVCSIVSDNEAKMCASWALVRDKYPRIVCFGCCAHALHLLVCDVLRKKPFAPVVEDARKLVDVAHSTKLWKKALRDAKCPALVADCNSRWGTTIALLSSLRDNKTALGAASVFVRQQCKDTDMSDGDKAALHFIETKDSWILVDDLVNLLEPACDAIFFFEGDRVRVSRVYDVLSAVFQKIVQSHAGDASKTLVSNEFLNRYRFLYHPVFVLAAVLHPERLANPEKHYAFPSQAWMGECLTALHDFDTGTDEAALQGQLNDYLSRRRGTLFEKISYSIGMDSFWAAGGLVAKSAPQLAECGRRMDAMSPTSAAAERYFSECGLLDDPFRSRLGLEKRKKLSFVHCEGRLKDRVLSGKLWDWEPKFSARLGLPVPPEQGMKKTALERSRNTPATGGIGKRATGRYESAESRKWMGIEKTRTIGDYVYVATVVEYISAAESAEGEALVQVLYDDGDRETMSLSEFESLDDFELVKVAVASSLISDMHDSECAYFDPGL